MKHARTAENALLDAVDQLTKTRRVNTWVEGAGDHPLKLVTVNHPPLLTMLVDGVQRSGHLAGVGATTPLPIDADALEMHAAIADFVALWCHQLEVDFNRHDLHSSLRRWYIAHVNMLRAGKVGDDVDHDVTWIVAGWVRMIERKFDPDRIVEYTDACPANIPLDIGTVRCGVRRVIVDGEERFAVRINATRLTAECAACGTRWEGMNGMRALRIEADRYARERITT